MKKLLFYVRMTAVQSASPTDILLGNKFMSNSGNLLFAASVARTVMTEDVQLDPFFSEDIDGMLSRIEEINESYECVVIPLANAFRADYRGKLRKLTSFIKAVSLPCYVIGVGIQASNIDQLKAGFSFDEDVKHFVSAVLKKSSLLGLRGQFTADYLAQLGFIPEQHFTVIGCPSAYIHGENCRKIQAKPYDEIKKVSINAKPALPRTVHELIDRSVMEFQDIHFVSQDMYEYWAMYFPYRRRESTGGFVPKYYPSSKNHPLWRDGRVIGFFRADAWLNFMADQDFSFGSRIHGNMAAVTAGTPAMIAAGDMRILELARYHGIPHIWKDDIKPETRLRDLYENADFGEFERRYKRNFSKYVDFLNQIGLQHIYDGNVHSEEGMAPYDRALPSDDEISMIYSGIKVPLTEKLRGLGIYPMMLRYKMDRRKLAREK